MSAQDIVLNVSYVLNFITMFLRQMLPLRIGMVIVSCGFWWVILGQDLSKKLQR